MTLPVDELLRRLSGAMRHEIAPAVGDEYNRTQAFMVSVILERLARQVAAGPGHQEAERADVAELIERLQPVLADAPPSVTEPLAGVAAAGSVASLEPVIAALYAWGIDRSAAAEALQLIRPVLRRDIDRRMEVAR